MTHRSMPPQTVRTAPFGAVEVTCPAMVTITTGTGTTRLRVRTGVSR